METVYQPKKEREHKHPMQSVAHQRGGLATTATTYSEKSYVLLFRIVLAFANESI